MKIFLNFIAALRSDKKVKYECMMIIL